MPTMEPGGCLQGAASQAQWPVTPTAVLTAEEAKEKA
uniref:Uncharacterized protein n=1 Tax=Arundo donax TaxID=35708 RepID=A0A0A9HLH7_ARUDO